MSHETSQESESSKVATAERTKYEELPSPESPTMIWEAEGAADYYAGMVKPSNLSETPHNDLYLRKFAEAESDLLMSAAGIQSRPERGYAHDVAEADKSTWTNLAFDARRVANGAEDETAEKFKKDLFEEAARIQKSRGNAHFYPERISYEMKTGEQVKVKGEDPRKALLSRLDGFAEAAMNDERPDLALRAFEARRSYRDITRETNAGKTIEYTRLSSQKLENPSGLADNKNADELHREARQLEKLEAKTRQVIERGGKKDSGAELYRRSEDTDQNALQRIEKLAAVYKEAIKEREKMR